MQKVATRLAALSFLALLASRAHAQPKPDAAAAQVLFDEGRKLLEKGDVNAACPKLAESQRLDPATGTLLNLADCYERQGKTASAWMGFVEAAEQSHATKHDSREKKARARAAALEPKLVRLTIEVPAPSRIPGLVVTRDGERVSEAAWNIAVPVDPGQHVIVARAPNHLDFTLPMTVTSGTSSLAIPPLAEVTGAAPIASLAPPPPSASTASPPRASATAAPMALDRAPPKDPGENQRSLAYVAGGIGVAGIVVGSIFGLVARSKNSDSLAQCLTTDKNACTSDGKGLRDSARSAGDVSTVAFLVGVAGLAGGAALYLTAPTSSGASAGVYVAPQGLTVRGRF